MDLAGPTTDRYSTRERAEGGAWTAPVAPRVFSNRTTNNAQRIKQYFLGLGLVTGASVSFWLAMAIVAFT